MPETSLNPADAAGRRRGRGYIFGVPLGDLGWFASLLMGLAAGFIAFFAGTFAGIVGVMLMNARGHHADFAWSYSRVGLPVGVVVAAAALGYLGTQWVRRITGR